MNLLKAEIKAFFQSYPNATYASLCSVVDWSRMKRVRFQTPANLIKMGLRQAYSAGMLPELDPKQESRIDQLLAEALSFEKDPDWRRRLSSPSQEETKIAAYECWKEWRLTNV